MSTQGGLVDAILRLKRKCRFEEEIGSRLDLTPVEMSCLLALGQGERLECRELSGQMGLSASRGSRIIQRLITRGRECERKLLARLDPAQLRKVNEGLDILLARL